MSCQQVPRLTEDPYTFTETAPVTAPLFNSQIHRLTPIITSPSVTHQKQINPQKSQTISQTRIIQQNQQQQLQTTRINGLSQLVNGVHKNVTSNTTANTKVQSQMQYQQTAAKITGNITTKKFLTPPSPTSVTIHQSHPLYSIAKQNSIISTSPITTSVPLPPLFQKSAQVIQSPGIPQTEYNAPQKNHSSSSKSMTVTIRTTQSPSITTLTNYVQQPVTISNLPAVSVSRQQQSVTASKISTSNLVDTKVSPDSKRKSLDSDQTIFATPAKRDSRTVLPSGKKAIKLQTSPNARSRRSYSQSAYHEALQRIPSSSSTASNAEWHAPDSYIFDSSLFESIPTSTEKSDDYDLVPCVQLHWLQFSDIISCIPKSSSITRDQRIELRKAQLRRQALQYITAQKFRNSQNARRRLLSVSKALQKLRQRDESPPPKKCCFPTCVNDALALTAYCYLHITINNDQYLFLPCTAKFSDNSQCRVPVFDISHELPLCREHAWKRDNYNRIVQEQKPKKPLRKRPKPSAMIRPQKRNKKKRKSLTTDELDNTNIGPVVTKVGYQLKSDEMSYIISRTPVSTVATYSTSMPDMLSICENSSAYESSEDTGVGGLSETELMVGAHDVIEEIPLSDTRLLEEHDLTNVLNQLPVDAFNELFTTVQQNGPLEPTQEEQEDLERALEAVNKQVKSLQQMTGGDSNFLGDFLDVDDQMLDDSDITEVVLHSPNTSSIETGGVIVDNSNGITNTASADIRGLVQT